MARIQIALGTDMRYFEPTLIAMLSVLRSTPEPITVHLFGLKLSDCAWQRLEAAARSRSAQLVRQVITGAMSSRWRSTFYDYISPAAIASLYVPSVVGKGRCLFLDSDTICFRDIRTLYDVNMQGRQIAAVMDYHWLKDHIHNPSARLESKRLMAPHSHLEMFNSGVVLFDCDAINADTTLTHSFLTTAPVPTGDQHQLNRTFKGRVAFAHPCWNCHSGLAGHYMHVQRQEVPKQFRFRHIPAAIWHFRGACKPWNTDDPLGASVAPLPDPLPADDDPQFDRIEPKDADWERALTIRRLQYRRAAARLLGEALPETM